MYPALSGVACAISKSQKCARRLNILQEVCGLKEWSKEILTNPRLLGIYLKREIINNKFDHYYHPLFNNIGEKWVGQNHILPTIKRLYILTEELPAQIFLFTLIHSPVYPGEISKFFYRSKQVVHYNIQKLCAAELLREHNEIDSAALAVIQKKAMSRQSGSRRLSFYRVADLDAVLLAASVKLSIEVLGIDEAKRIASYTRNYEKPDYNLYKAVISIIKIKDRNKREIAILEWSKDLGVSVRKLKQEVEKFEKNNV